VIPTVAAHEYWLTAVPPLLSSRRSVPRVRWPQVSAVGSRCDRHDDDGPPPPLAPFAAALRGIELRRWTSTLARKTCARDNL